MNGGWNMDDYIMGYANLMNLSYSALAGLSIILIMFVIFMGLCTIIAFCGYILKCISLYKISNEKFKWLCWVPVFNNIILTKIAFSNYILGVIMSFCLLCVIFIPNNFSSILLFTYFIIYIISSYKVYKIYSKNYILLTIVSVLTLTLAIPFILFSIRNKKERVDISNS